MTGAPGIALVTGGTRGIGRCIAEALLSDGFTVWATYRSDAESARRFEEEAGGSLKTRQLDVADAAGAQALVEEIEAKGALELLVCNAGISIDRLAHAVEPDDFSNVFGANVAGVVNLIRAVLPKMQRRRRGDIVAISSLAARNVRAGNALYGASKAALERYCQTVAVEAIRLNVAVNVIAPGFVATQMTEEFLDPARRRELLATIPARRLTQPAEIADAVRFLRSRKPVLVGATLPVGGGAHL